jgi:hypothetical protein
MSKPVFLVKQTRAYAVPRPPNFVRDAETDAAIDVADLSQQDAQALADAMREELFANIRRRRDARRRDAQLAKAVR